jgi:hypothetical protein
VALTLCAACGHAPGPVLEEPTAEEQAAEHVETESATPVVTHPASEEAPADDRPIIVSLSIEQPSGEERHYSVDLNGYDAHSMRAVMDELSFSNEGLVSFLATIEPGTSEATYHVSLGGVQPTPERAWFLYLEGQRYTWTAARDVNVRPSSQIQWRFEQR